MNSDLAIATNWLRDHWDYPPVRLTARGVDVQSAWGAPPFSAAFQRWLEHSDDTLVQQEPAPCDHYWTHGRSEGCGDCQGTGMKQVEVKVFVFPMRAAMSRLRKHVHAAPGVVHPADFIYRLALMDWNVEAACAAVGLPESRGEEQLLSAIRLLQGRYGERPYTSTRRPKSENQLVAEAAAA